MITITVTCDTCGRQISLPWRGYDQGRIREELRSHRWTMTEVWRSGLREHYHYCGCSRRIIRETQHDL